MTEQGANPETPTEEPASNVDGEPPDSGSRRRRRRRRRKHKNGDKRNRIEDCFRDLLRLYGESDGNPSAITGAVSDVLTLTLGSVPSFAVGESMIAASQAQSQMLNNAVANQQRINMVGMTATTQCVRQLLRLDPGGYAWDDGDDDGDHGGGHDGGHGGGHDG